MHKLSNKIVKANLLFDRTKDREDLNLFLHQLSFIHEKTFNNINGVSVNLFVKELFEKYSKSKFAKETGWGELMMTYHEYITDDNRIDTLPESRNISQSRFRQLFFYD